MPEKTAPTGKHEQTDLLSASEKDEIEAELRLDALKPFHDLAVAILGAVEDHDNDPLAKAARQVAVRMKKYLIDGVEDYDAFLIWWRCQEAVARAFPDSHAAKMVAGLSQVRTPHQDELNKLRFGRRLQLPPGVR